MLSDNLKCDMKTIELILLYLLNLSSDITVKSIEHIVKHLAGSIHEVNTPILSLTSLEKVLAESRSPVSEINTFNLNGFNQVIDLEEKKYTTVMKVGVFCITTLALVQISVGVSLQLMYFPIGPYLLAQGIDDFIYVTSCVLSGHFSWRSYMSHKLISLVTTSISCYVTLKSTYATKSAGMSVQTMKEKVLGTMSKIKSSVRHIFSSEVPSQVTKTEIITQMCKRVVVHAAEGVAYGASFTLVDRLIRSQEEFLDESLTRLVHSDINNTITNHPAFQSVIELYKKMGKTKTENIIKTSLCKITHSWEQKLQTTFDSIDLRSIYTLIERTISKGFNGKSGLSKAIQIATIFQNVLAVVKPFWSHYKEVSSLVDQILNDVKQELLTESIKLTEEWETQVVKIDELSVFKCEVLNVMQCNIQRVFSAHIRKNFVSPVLQAVGTYVEQYSVKMISKTRSSFLTDEEMFKLNKRKNQNFKRKSKVRSEIKRPGFFSYEFDEITREVLKTRKNKMVLSYLVSQNAPMDMYCLQLCFEVIPLALKQEGLSVPTLRVEVEKNGTKQVFCIGDVRDDTPTLRITPDADLSSNVKNNKILVTDVFNFLYKSFLENYPELKGLTATLLQELVVKSIDHYCNSQSSWSTADDGNQTFEKEWVCKDSASFKVSQINTECERKTPYQHSICVGGWIFSPHVDVDLREKAKLTNWINIQKHVSKGFETALVNTHIHRIQGCLSSFNLVLDDFAATKHQLTPPPPDMSELFHCYTVQYELVIPVILKGINRLVDFNILLHLENEKPKNKLPSKSPLGPHILYEINPVNDAKFLNKGLKGHILLNTDIAVARYSLNDCHVAGELIVSSALRKPATPRESATPVAKGSKCELAEDKAPSCEVGHGEATDKECDTGKASSCEVGHGEATKKECDAIIIGDSLFKYIYDYIRLPKCEFGIFPHFNVNQFRRKIMSFLANYQGIKCVVLFLGNDIVKSNIPEHKLVNCIFDVVKHIQGNIRNVKVVICTLVFVKQSADKCNGKISNVNKRLKDYCTRYNLVNVDTNRIICPQDLGKDGIHLNRSGYHKLGNHISEVCKEIINLR